MAHCVSPHRLKPPATRAVNRQLFLTRSTRLGRLSSVGCLPGPLTAFSHLSRCSDTDPELRKKRFLALSTLCSRKDAFSTTYCIDFGERWPEPPGDTALHLALRHRFAAAAHHLVCEQVQLDVGGCFAFPIFWSRILAARPFARSRAVASVFVRASAGLLPPSLSSRKSTSSECKTPKNSRSSTWA